MSDLHDGRSLGAGAPGSVRELLVEVARRLGSAAEARWVVEHVVGSTPGAISLALGGEVVDATQQAEIDHLVARREGGEPLQYLLGKWPFRSIELEVDPRVLIPRPETEVVTGYALDELSMAASVVTGERRDRVVAVDLGTGSGAIALSLAAEGISRVGDRDLEVWATDISQDALDVALVNSRSLGLEVNFAAGSWFDALPSELVGEISLVVSNPPYVSESQWQEIETVVRDYEPRAALVAGDAGTEAIEALLEDAPRWLAPGGALVLEISPQQAEDSALRALLAGFDGVLVKRDMAGRSRALVARRW